MIQKITFSLLFLITISAFCQQEKMNNYKYVIVQEKFDFLKKADQYQTSSLTKFLLEKSGFVVFLNKENFPKDLIQNRCLALTAAVIDDSNMFTVKNKIQFKDCFGNVIYTSKLGKSKEKEYKKSYQEAIRKAYKTMADLKYVYKPDTKISSNNDDVVQKVTSPTTSKTILKTIPKVKKSAPIKKAVSKDVSSVSSNLETLYAQVKPNGFQLVNITPAIIFQALKTNLKEVFILKDKNGILYKNGASWIAEYYDNDVLVIKQYSIKF